MATGLPAVRRPEEPHDVVPRHIPAGLGAEVEGEPELQFGLGGQPDSTRVDFSLAEYSAADSGERH